MTAHTTLSAAAVPLSAIAGSKIGAFLATTDTTPSWAAGLLGPIGALVGTLLAIRWLLARLDKSEAKHDAREVERDRNFQTLVTLTVQNQEIIEQNSSVLRDVKTKLEK